METKTSKPVVKEESKSPCCAPSPQANPSKQIMPQVIKTQEQEKVPLRHEKVPQAQPPKHN